MFQSSQRLPSESIILLTITLDLELKLIEGELFGCVLLNVSPPIIFPSMFLIRRFHPNVRLCLVTVSINGLI